VIDNFAMLLRPEDETTTISLADRARDVAEVCVALHDLAAEHDLAVVIVNEVSDVFAQSDTAPISERFDGPLYRDVAQWFSTASNVAGEDTREPALGLAFANQVNCRVMFTKTGRRRMSESAGPDPKRRRLLDVNTQPTASQIEDDILLRHMSVIFSCVAVPSSVDYVITKAGVASCGEPTRQVQVTI